MSYEVNLTQHVLSQIEAHVVYLRGRGAGEEVAASWLTGLLGRIDDLSRLPRRFRVDPERSADRGYELRRMNYGVYAVFFRMDEAQRRVEVLDFRHGHRRPEHEEEEER